jgi:hypothetical protein
MGYFAVDLKLVEIPPNPPLEKGGNGKVPLWKRGIERDFNQLR